MARNKHPRFPGDNGNARIELTPTGPTVGTLVAPAGGIIINYIIATNNDSNNPTVILRILDTSDNVLNELGKYTLTALAGTDGATDPDDVKALLTFLDVDGAGNPMLILKATDKLQVTANLPGGGAEIMTVSIGYGSLEEDA